VHHISQLYLSSEYLTGANLLTHFSLTQQDVVQEEIDHENHGKLHLGLKFVTNSSPEYDPTRTTGTIHITTREAKHLPGMGPQSETNSFVSCYLLPDNNQRSTVKTSVVSNNQNPTWQEEFTYNNISLEELKSKRVLEVTVWNRDQTDAKKFIGGIRVGPNPTCVRTSKPWMDSKEKEISHWDAMLSNPGEWVEEWHMLRPSMNYLGDYKDVHLSSEAHRAQLKTTAVKGISTNENHLNESTDVITPLASSLHGSSITTKSKDLPTKHRSQSLGSTLPANAHRQSGSQEVLQSNSTNLPPRSRAIASTSSKVRNWLHCVRYYKFGWYDILCKFSKHWNNCLNNMVLPPMFDCNHTMQGWCGQYGRYGFDHTTFWSPYD